MNERVGDSYTHQPVMIAQVLEWLAPHPGEFMVDGTLGLGGHAEAICRAIGEEGRFLGIDRDAVIAERARERLVVAGACDMQVMVSDFAHLSDCLSGFGKGLADGILLDLGVSSPQIDDPERGFSYRADGPLDMRMGQGAYASAGEWINHVPEKELADILWKYGDERFSRRIARAVVRVRARSPITRTYELAEIIRRAVPPGPRRLHPARRSFQAIRIYINDEMGQLEQFLAALPSMLKPGGRCVVISYHSLEDRRVKNAFRDGRTAGYYELLTRKPLRPSYAETQDNPRSRSARLRAVRRTDEGDAI